MNPIVLQVGGRAERSCDGTAALRAAAGAEAGLVHLAPGGDLLAALASHGPDAVILGPNLPGPGLLEACLRLRTLPAAVPLPILVLADPDDRIRALGAGADVALGRDTAAEELAAQTAALLRRADRARSREEPAQRLEEALRRRTEELWAVEEKFRLLFDESPDAIFVESEDGIVLDVNPAGCRLHRMPREELLGRRVDELVPPESREHVRREFPKWFSGDLTLTRGWSLSNDGHSTPVELAASVIEYNGRRAALLHVRDVSERMRAEKELRRAEEKYRMLVEQLPAITYVFEGGGPGRTTYISPQVNTMLGFTPHEWMLDRELWFRQIHPDERDEVVAQIRQHDLTREPFQIEYRVLARDGRTIWFRNLGRYVQETPGGPWVLHGVMIDLSARKEAEAALRRSEEQLAHAQKMEALGRLSGGIAHDFNNLLTVILGFGQMLRQNPALDPRLHNDLDEIIRAGERAETLARQFLSISQRHPAQRAPMDINETVHAMDRLLRRTLGKDIEFVTILDEAPCVIEADPDRIGQVIVNLAVNARQAMEKGGRVTIETRRCDPDREAQRQRPDMPPGPWIVLDMADTGTGMTPEVRARAFEPFFTTRSAEGGTGLGLALVYGIVTEAGGFIELDSRPGTGTRFRIHFPASSKAAPRRPDEDRTPAKGGTETVVIVDDERAVRKLAARMLGSAGYRVFEASDGFEALRICEREGIERIGLVLSDLVMPRMSGTELARELRRQRPALRLLMMTGYAQDTFADEAPDGPLIPVFAKPFTRDQLVRRVREVLDGAPVPPGPATPA